VVKTYQAGKLSPEEARMKTNEYFVLGLYECFALGNPAGAEVFWRAALDVWEHRGFAASRRRYLQWFENALARGGWDDCCD